MLVTEKDNTAAAVAAGPVQTDAGASGTLPDGSLVTVPPTPLNTPARGPSPSRRTSLQRDSAAGHGAVMVVDDLALNRIVLGHMVRKAGLEVVEAANGAECLEQLCRNPPGRFECILMDLQMPVMDGWEATHQVRLWEAGGGQSCSSDGARSAMTTAPGSPGPAIPQRLSHSHTSPVAVPIHAWQPAAGSSASTSSMPQMLSTTSMPQMFPRPVVTRPVSAEADTLGAWPRDAADLVPARCKCGRVHGQRLGPIDDLCSNARRSSMGPSRTSLFGGTMLPTGWPPLSAGSRAASPSLFANLVPGVLLDGPPLDDGGRHTGPPLMRTLARGDSPPLAEFMLNRPRSPSALWRDLDLPFPPPRLRGGANSAPSYPPAEAQQRVQDWVSGDLPGVSMLVGSSASAPVIRRIPIVACTAELLDSPPAFAGGASPSSGSACGGATAASHAISCGVDECVKKPLSYPALCEILERYIPHWAAPVACLVPRPPMTEFRSLQTLPSGPSTPAFSATATAVSSPVYPEAAKPAPSNAPLQLLAMHPSWPERNGGSWQLPAHPTPHPAAWPAALVTTTAGPVVAPTAYGRSLSGEPETVGPMSPLANAEAARHAFARSGTDLPADVSPDALGQLLPIRPLSPPRQEPRDRSSEESFDAPSFAMFDATTGAEAAADELARPADLVATDGAGNSMSDSSDAQQCSRDGSNESGSAGDGTARLDSQGLDMQEHLVELMPFLSIAPKERLEGTRSGSGNGSWGGPWLPGSDSDTPQPPRTSQPTRSDLPRPARQSPLGWQQRVQGLSRLGTGDSAPHARPPVSTTVDIPQASWRPQPQGSGTAPSAGVHESGSHARGLSSGAEVEGVASSSAGSGGPGAALWGDAEEEAHVRALCAWEPADYVGLAGAEAALAEASGHRR